MINILITMGSCFRLLSYCEAIYSILLISILCSCLDPSIFGLLRISWSSRDWTRSFLTSNCGDFGCGDFFACGVPPKKRGSKTCWVFWMIWGTPTLGHPMTSPTCWLVFFSLAVQESPDYRLSKKQSSADSLLFEQARRRKLAANLRVFKKCKSEVDRLDRIG